MPTKVLPRSLPKSQEYRLVRREKMMGRTLQIMRVSRSRIWEAMEAGEEVEWTAKVQIMQPEEADANLLGFDPFDVTKVWPRAQFPVSST
jgi:catalase